MRSGHAIEMEKVNVDGTSLEYEVQGSGEPVLLISTGPIADSFLPLFAEKALDRYRLIRYRQRRLGRESGAAPVSFAQHAADAAALLGRLGIRRAHVAGHSTGAIIALQLAVDRPDLVHSLALLEPPLAAAAGAGAFFEKAGPALAAYGAGDGDGAIARFLSAVSGLDWETCRSVIDTSVPGGVARAMSSADDVFRSYLPAIGAWPFGAVQAASLTQPVLSVVGTESEPWFGGGHALLREWFPRAEDCTVDGVAHLLHLQRAEPVAQGLAGFLGRHAMRES